MTAEQFAYWLQGFNEINGSAPTEEQWQIIKDHLATVFLKVTPNRVPNQEGWHDYLRQSRNPGNLPDLTTIIC